MLSNVADAPGLAKARELEAQGYDTWISPSRAYSTLGFFRDPVITTMLRDGNTRLVETAIPWTEIPEVKKRLDAGQPIKFSFRVNDNAGAGYELNGGRSVSKINTYSFHDYWSTSWAVETEFTFEK